MALPRRTIVKICGITRLEDARLALEAGADWVGFVMVPQSPRAIEPEAVSAIARQLPRSATVAVLVNPDPTEALRIAARASIGRLQVHRSDPTRWPADYALPTCFAVTVDPAGKLAGMMPDRRHLVMLDTADSRLAGGTGRSFPWSAAAELAATRPVMLAGGLDCDNVAGALSRVRPYGVDASSQLEVAPGIKDAAKVRLFIETVRAWDARQAAAHA